MQRKKKLAGFTIVELLLALTMLAALMTAVAIAFDAAVKNYKDNETIYKTVHTARSALLRITNDVRTASGIVDDADPLNIVYYPAVQPVAADAAEITVQTISGKNVRYRYDNAAETLYYDDLDAGLSYVLCENVTAMKFNGSSCTVRIGTHDYTDVRSVRMSITVTDDKGLLPQTLSAAAVVRRNL